MYSLYDLILIQIIGLGRLVSSDWNRVYLLSHTQHPRQGGFGKQEDVYPGTSHVFYSTYTDPLHSCLGLASLALNGEEKLLPFDAALCITQRAKQRISHAPWRKT